MSGGGSRFSIPGKTRKMIQNIKEITGNHSEEEIYAMLKDCSMDPNETAQRLLLQGIFPSNFSFKFSLCRFILIRFDCFFRPDPCFQLCVYSSEFSYIFFSRFDLMGFSLSITYCC